MLASLAKPSRTPLALAVCASLALWGGVRATASASTATPVAAQQSAPGLLTPNDQSWSPEGLEDLLAPVALYPDAFIVHVLVASTNPQEVLDAGNWRSKNANLSGAPLDAGAAGPVIMLPRLLRDEVERRGLLRTAEERAAFDTALSVLLSRGDVQLSVLQPGERIDLPKALAWAHEAAAGGTDSDSARLRPHEAALAELTARARTLGDPLYPLTEGLPQPLLR